MVIYPGPALSLGGRSDRQGPKPSGGQKNFMYMYMSICYICILYCIYFVQQQEGPHLQAYAVAPCSERRGDLSTLSPNCRIQVTPHYFYV